MKKIIAIVLMLLMVFSLASCDDGEVPASVLDEFKAARTATLSSKVNVSTKFVCSLGELNSNVDTVFNPDGSATVTYSIEKFNEDLTSGDVTVTNSGVVTYKNGKYSDGGEFEGTLSETALAKVDINLDETKMEFKVEGGVLNASVKAENVKDVLGIDVGADVSFTLTVSGGKIASLAINYTLEAGTVTVFCTYN